MRILNIITCIALLAIFSGCKTLMETVSTVGTTVGVATGTLTPQQAESIKKTSTAVGNSFEAITPEQEYYIGRAVGASILKAYKPVDNQSLNNYINLLGQTLAAASDKPETFGGYHFLVLDTDEINAFAAPGGLVFVSRGLLKCCQTEDAVASVLAHEIGHVQNGHGLQAIKKSRLTSAFTILAAEGAKNLGGEQLAQLTTAFEGTIGDITSTMINSGYARKFETQSDTAAVTILNRVGYNPNALKDMLIQISKNTKPGSKGFAKTHPDPMDRVRDIQSLIGGAGAVKQPEPRKNRFTAAMASI